MRVRGAFFGFIGKIFKAIGEFLWSLLKGVAAFIKSIVTGLVDGIKSFLTGMGQFFGGLFTGDFDLVLKGLFNAFVLANMQIVGGWINAPVAQSNEVARGLESFGLPPVVIDGILLGTNIVFGTAAIAAGITTGNPILVGTGISIIGGSTTEFLSEHTSLSPTVTSIISIGAIAAGAFAGSGFSSGSLSGAISGFKTALPFLAKDLASAGVVGVGGALGLDPRISGLIAVPLSAGIGVGTDSLVHAKNFSAGSLFTAVKSGLVAGASSVISVAASIGLDAIGVPPILQNFVPGILGQLLPGSIGNAGSEVGGGIFKRLSENARKFGKTVVNTAGNVVSFAHKVFENGVSLIRQSLAKTAELFSNIFNRDTIENLSNGGQITIEQRILTSGNFIQNGDLFSWDTEFGGEKISIMYLGDGGYVVGEGSSTKTFQDLFLDGFGGFAGNISLTQDLGDGIRLAQDIAGQSSSISFFEEEKENSFMKIDMGRTGEIKRIENSSLGTYLDVNEGRIVDYGVKNLDSTLISQVASIAENLRDFVLASVGIPTALAEITVVNGQEIVEAIKLAIANVNQGSDPFVEALQVFSNLPEQITLSGNDIKNLVLQNIPPENLAQVTSEQMAILNKIHQISKNGQDLLVDFTEPFEAQMVDDSGKVTKLKIQGDMKIKMIKSPDGSIINIEFQKERKEPWPLRADAPGLPAADVSGFVIKKTSDGVTSVFVKIPIFKFTKEVKIFPPDNN